MPRLKRTWIAARASFWFLPYLIVVLSIGLGVTMMNMENSALARWMHSHPTLFAVSTSGAREMVSIIASSMMAVVGIVFSITLVALALASTQYSSRVLPTFMRSRVTQASLGIFAGIYLYCLIVLRGMPGEEPAANMPILAVSVAALLALLGVAVLVFFIHHIARSIQASTILALIQEETIASLKHLFPQQLGAGGPPPPPNTPQAPADGDWICLAANVTGYIQSMDEQALIQFACRHCVVLRLEHSVGQFVIAGTPLFSVAGSSPLSAAAVADLHAAVAVDRHRTVEQDPTFGMRELVDVALKALSPGMNDTTTAIICIDHLTAIMSELTRRTIPSPYRYAGGSLKVIAHGPGYGAMLGEAFDQIRRSGVGNVSVLVRLSGAIGTLAGLTVPADRVAALAQQLDAISEASSRGDLADRDRALILDHVRLARTRVEHAAARARQGPLPGP